MNSLAYYMAVTDDGKTVGFLPSTTNRHALRDQFYLDAVVMNNYFDAEFYEPGWMFLTPTSYLRTVTDLPSRPLSDFYHEDQVDFDVTQPARLGECYLIEDLNAMFVFIGAAFVEYPYDFSEWSDRFWDESLCVDELSETDRNRQRNNGVMNEPRIKRTDESSSRPLH